MNTLNTGENRIKKKIKVSLWIGTLVIITAKYIPHQVKFSPLIFMPKRLGKLKKMSS